MEASRKRHPGEIALGFFLLSHPAPVLFHTIAVTAFVLLAAWPHLSGGTIVLLVAAHTAMQLSIAVLNDYCDRRLDAIQKQDKPIPRGLAYPHEALLLGLFWIAVMVLLLWPLNLWALLISFLYLAFGQAYNLGLKATPLSGIVFALAIPLIPVYAFVGVGHILSIVFWLVPVAALLGVALNLANSLPDLEGDANSGIRTLAVVLGVRGTLLACPLLLLSAMLLIALLTVTRVVPAHGEIVLSTLLIAVLGLVILYAFLRGERKAGKAYFYGVVMICLVVGGGWLVGVMT